MVQEFLASLGLEGSLCFHMRERYCEIPLEPWVALISRCVACATWALGSDCELNCLYCGANRQAMWALQSLLAVSRLLVSISDHFSKLSKPFLCPKTGVHTVTTGCELGRFPTFARLHKLLQDPHLDSNCIHYTYVIVHACIIYIYLYLYIYMYKILCIYIYMYIILSYIYNIIYTQYLSQIWNLQLFGL